MVSAVNDALPLGITEVHMVGGLHPTLKKDWYLNLLHRLRALDPNLHIKAFTAIEVRHLAQRIFRMPIRDTLELLRDAGLRSMTGADPETLDGAARNRSRSAHQSIHGQRGAPSGASNFSHAHS